ncbi:hypothetical protein [Tsukamurella pulmonis]|uniref:hypothetical protein n=1 Tax=Tsukamurella pulmonis TaxID=47312 RepID=UPI000E08D5FD|nr:hypothetical protein [Tsukamurella pulmonis]RDH13560.1 hypothetical protein DVB88_01760 [Tsukamurella pulmonis]
MAYVIKRIPGLVGSTIEIGYELGGEWCVHTSARSMEEAEAIVNRLNGGNFAGTREDVENQAAERRAREAADLAIAREQTAAAKLDAANLAERERVNQEALAANERFLAAQARQADEDRAKWLAAQEEDRRRAEREAAEQLRLYPPAETVIVGGVGSWDGTVTFHRSDGEIIAVKVWLS